MEIESEFLPIKEAKLNDLKDSLQYVDEEIRDSEFFTPISTANISAETQNDYEA